MKKITAWILVLALCLGLTACGGTTAVEETPKVEENVELSKAAYEQINIAYEIIEQMGEDIYEAWRLGIYEKEDLAGGGAKYLASKLDLTEEDLREGIGYALIDMAGKDWNTIPPEEKDEYFALIDDSFRIIQDAEEISFFSYCTWCVKDAYLLNGKTEQAQAALTEAKACIKELSEKYADYEHYPTLKEYYATTSAFLEFCLHLDGSFEQAKETINAYRNDARDYVSKLDLTFGD